jgi:hypothetical protein
MAKAEPVRAYNDRFLVVGALAMPGWTGLGSNPNVPLFFVSGRAYDFCYWWNPVETRLELQLYLRPGQVRTDESYAFVYKRAAAIFNACVDLPRVSHRAYVLLWYSLKDLA